MTWYEHALSQWIFDFAEAKLADSDARTWVGWGFENLLGWKVENRFLLSLACVRNCGVTTLSKSFLKTFRGWEKRGKIDG